MQLPGPGVFGPPRDHDQALAVLRRAIELDVNHIDTAQFYGPNVSRLGPDQSTSTQSRVRCTAFCQPA
jgi:aryl-alcohol dehydrogenase-like predicted oxidoreductase